MGPDLFVAGSAPRHSRSTQTALAEILKLLLVRCQGTCVLGKLHLRQSPKPCAGMVATFRELYAKILTLQE